jgi:hypothetical protein
LQTLVGLTQTLSESKSTSNLSRATSSTDLRPCSISLSMLNLYKKHHGNAMQFWKRIFEIYHANESLLEKHVEFFGTSAFVGRFLASSVLTTDYQEFKEAKQKGLPYRE